MSALRARAIVALRLHGELKPAELARELGRAYSQAHAVLCDLVRAGEVEWTPGGPARLKVKPAMTTNDVNSELATLTGYSVRDGLGNEVAWFVDRATALELWHEVPDADSLADVAARATLLTMGGE